MSLKFTRAVANAQGLSPKAKNLLRVLADRADKEGRSFARQARLAEDMGVSERTVRAALKELETAQWIVRERRYRRDGARSSDLVTVRDLKGAAQAAEALLQLPLMRVIEAGKAVEKAVDTLVAEAEAYRQNLPVGLPAKSAGYREPITLTEDSNRSEARPARVRRAVGGGSRAAALALLDDVYGVAQPLQGKEGDPE